MGGVVATIILSVKEFVNLYAHGSNDGQKGMGLIMLILIGTVPTAYALNHALTAQDSVTSWLCRSRRRTCWIVLSVRRCSG